MRQPRVELLYIERCPNYEDALALVERVASQLDVRPRIDLVLVPDADAAVELRFLGSPTIRVDGHDVEPGADERRLFAYSCRLYRREHGFEGEPDEAWVRRALEAAAP